LIWLFSRHFTDFHFDWLCFRQRSTLIVSFISFTPPLFFNFSPISIFFVFSAFLSHCFRRQSHARFFRGRRIFSALLLFFWYFHFIDDRLAAAITTPAD
jgi:hypothetical protein